MMCLAVFLALDCEALWDQALQRLQLALVSLKDSLQDFLVCFTGGAKLWMRIGPEGAAKGPDLVVKARLAHAQ